jgi:hypothetical protein
MTTAARAKLAVTAFDRLHISRRLVAILSPVGAAGHTAACLAVKPRNGLPEGLPRRLHAALENFRLEQRFVDDHRRVRI